MSNFLSSLFVVSASTVCSTVLVANLVQAAPAPPLSYVQIRFIGSSNYPSYEPIADNQLSTVIDHGGPALRAVTVEVGYGNPTLARATINGVALPRSANYLTVPFCNLSNFLASCSAGQTVVGFVNYWNLDGYQSGIFTYQATSTNSPFNTLSDRLTIR